MARKVFWRGGSGEKSVLVQRERQEEYFGAAGAAKQVFWRGGSGKKSVLAWRERQEKCFGVAGVARKVFWRGGSDYSAPAIKSEQRFWFPRILSATITIDRWTGAWSDDLALRRG